MTGRRCYVRDCGENIPRESLMCTRHWAKVPKPLQRQICIARARKDQEAELEAADEACARMRGVTAPKLSVK